jgi:hypothetical protein
MSTPKDFIGTPPRYGGTDLFLNSIWQGSDLDLDNPQFFDFYVGFFTIFTFTFGSLPRLSVPLRHRRHVLDLQVRQNVAQCFPPAPALALCAAAAPLLGTG